MFSQLIITCPSSKTEADSIMKTSAIKNFTKTVAATMSAVFTFTLIPMALGQNAVIAATAITKDQSNTSLGVSGIKDPTLGGDADSEWAGCYVYFGNYNGPIKFRVLKVDSTAHTASEALFLDSDSVLFNKSFDDDSNKWKDSELRNYLNGDFIDTENGYFTASEVSAIASNTELNGEKIFVLDEREASNSAYGYSNTFYSCASRKKTGGYGNWWLRSADFHLSYLENGVGNDGDLYDYNVDVDFVGVAPALNINQESIIFSTKIKDFGNDFGEYKLTIMDENLNIAVPAGQYVTATGTTITVPYEISGKDAGTATRATILITDNVWDAEKANIILYDELGASTASSGKFSLPSGRDLSGWGTDYHVYILAENINDVKETDYASELVELKSEDIVPAYTVTYKVANGTWSDGSTADITETVVEGSSPSSIPEGMLASSGYEKGEWDTDPSTASISADTTFTYSFKAIPTYTVTVQNDGNGTATADVTSGPKGTEVSLTATPSSGYLFKEWQVVSGGVTITDNKFTIGTSDVKVKAIFDAIPTYTVTVQNDGNGTATANVTSGSKGTEVILTATPSTGYQFKEWQVVSGGVTVTDNKFTIGTSDVTVKAVFEAEPVSVEPPKSTGPFTYTVVGGGDSTWTEGDPDLVVKVTSDEDGDHSFDRYEYTAIDGTKLTDEQAPASSGSTVITIKSDLLKTLSEGKHTILINFSDNSITTTVTIVKKAAGTSNVPSTGEVIGVSAIAGTVLILSACSILIVMRTKKREEEQ